MFHGFMNNPVCTGSVEVTLKLTLELDKIPTPTVLAPVNGVSRKLYERREYEKHFQWLQHPIRDFSMSHHDFLPVVSYAIHQNILNMI
jgi:hypothetical protein